MHDTTQRVPAAWTWVAIEQVQLVGLRLRRAGAALLALAILIAVAFVWMLVRVNVDALARHDQLMRAALAKPGSESLVPVIQTILVLYSPLISMVVVAVALVLPLAIWQDEPPTHREYHLVMPMRASTHTLLRVAGGWVWMMVITTVFLMLLVGSFWTMNVLSPYPTGVHLGFARAWEWLVPFTAVTVAYLFASAAAVGARRPLVWLGGTFVVYTGVVTLLEMLKMKDAAEWIWRGYGGYYGAAAALTGAVEGAGGISSLSRWLGSTALWGVAALVMLIAVANRNAER